VDDDRLQVVEVAHQLVDADPLGTPPLLLPHDHGATTN
jgi:hypothetical protein